MLRDVQKIRQNRQNPLYFCVFQAQTFKAKQHFEFCFPARLDVVSKYL